MTLAAWPPSRYAAPGEDEGEEARDERDTKDAKDDDDGDLCAAAGEGSASGSGGCGEKLGFQVPGAIGSPLWEDPHL